MSNEQLSGKSKITLEDETGIRHYDLFAFPITLTRGGPTQVLIFGKDTTVEQHLTKALVQSRQMFKDLVSCSTDFAWETDNKGRFKYVSPNGILGYTAYELNDKQAADLIVGQDGLNPFDTSETGKFVLNQEGCFQAYVINIELASAFIVPDSIQEINCNGAGCCAIVTDSIIFCIADTIPPVINCTDITVDTDSGMCGANVSWSYQDNCGIASVQGNYLSGDFFAIGTDSVEFIVIDSSGNADTCHFQVTVEDNEAPVWTICPQNITVNNDPGSCQTIVGWNAPVAVDNCALDSISSNYQPLDSFPLGFTTVTYTAVDTSGNQSVCSFVIHVVDNEPPVISNIPSDITIYANDSVCCFPLSWIVPDITDNCPGVSLIANFNPGDLFCGELSPFTVTYTGTDASGNQNLSSFQIQIIDTIPPVWLSCPGDIIVENDTLLCETDVFWTPPIPTDNCAGFTFTNTHNPGDSFDVGVHTVTYVLSDIGGNIDICSFSVTVLDTDAPVIECPNDTTFYISSVGCNSVVELCHPTLFENCELDSFTWQISTNNDVEPAVQNDCFLIDLEPGPYTLTYIATDTSGNKDTCEYLVTMTDSIFPEINCFTDTLTFYVPDTSCVSDVSWGLPFYSDNCPGSVLKASASPGQFPVGDSIITYTVTDWADNQSTCSLVMQIIDTVPPVIYHCPNDTTLVLGENECEKQVFWQMPFADDNCGIFADSISHQSGDIFPIGMTTVVYIAVDSSGNADTCRFSIHILDTISPQIFSCNDQIVRADLPGCLSSGPEPPLFTDNCSNQIIQYTPPPPYLPGEYTVKAVVTDLSGNADSCVFNLTVQKSFDLVVSSDTMICLGAEVGLWAGGAQSYQWSPPAYLSQTDIPNPISAPEESVIYQMIGQDEICADTAEVSVEIFLAVETEIYTGDSLLCEGEVTNLVSENGAFTVWGHTDLTHKEVFIQPPESNTYYGVAYTADSICRGRPDSVPIEVFPIPTTYFIPSQNPANPGTTIHFDNQTSDGLIYLWEIEEEEFPYEKLFSSTEPEIQYFFAEEGNFVVNLTVIGDNSCDSTYLDTIRIRKSTTYRPTAFTPNNDGINDRFIVYANNFQSYHLQIYDRWGELIWDTFSPEPGWDGTHDGRPCQEGVYVCKYEIINLNGDTEQGRGTVTLIR